MDFFNGGNLLTLGIVAVAFLLFRYLDRNNRNINLARKYGEELKDDLEKEFGEFTEAKSSELRDYGVILEADFKRAEALKKNIESGIIALEKKYATINDLNERINKYDFSLKHLDSWTEKVEENLRRIEVESRYVENVAEKISGVKTALDEINKAIGDVRNRISIETDSAVKETSETILKSMQDAVSDLKAATEEIGREAEEHGKAIKLAEANRKAALEKDMAAINDVLQKTLSVVTEHSNEIEAELLREINEAAAKRADDLRQSFEEKVAEAERSIANRIGDVEKVAEAAREAWENENARILDEQQRHKNNWRQSLEEKVAEAERSIADRIVDTKKAAEAAREAWENENARILDEQQRYKNDWRQSLEEKVAEAERSIADRIGDAKKAAEAAREAWENENARILDEQQQYKNDWQQDMSKLDTLALDQRNLWQNLLDESDEAIEQYRRAQQARLADIENMADDTAKLDAELRLHVESVKNETSANFAAFAAEMKQNYDNAMGGFNKTSGVIQSKIDELEKEINGLRSEAYEKVSDNLKEFHELINSDLAKRNENINYQIDELRGGLDKRLGELVENVEAECRKIEHSCGETLRQKRDKIDAAFDEEIALIKDALATIEKNIGIQTERYEEAVRSLETQLKNSLEDAGKTVENTLKAEISRFELQNSDRLKKHERGMEETLQAAAAEIEARLDEIKSTTSKSYDEVETYKTDCAERLNELDAAIEDLRARGKDTAAENEERLAAARSKIDEIAADISRQRAEMLAAAAEKVKSLENAIADAEKRIGDFFDKKELIDKTVAVKNDLEQKIEDLNINMEKLNLRGIEIAEIKTQFERLRRMEEDLNNKMTRFGIEQQRIERMEINFNRLLQTSQSVEERLKHITDADDMLQEAEIKLRKLGDLTVETDEKYQRVEKKKQALEVATDGIEKNFKSLQESETVAQKLNGDIQRITIGLEDIRSAIETLANENDKAQDTVEKLSTLDQTISDIERRMQNLQKARAWLADLETRMDEKYREVKHQLKLTDSIIKHQDDRIQIEKEGSLPIGIRDDVFSLKKRGWSVDDIAKSLKISRAAVELILETVSKES
ncbi:MAG: hypothetical protein LBH50_04085 [Spirochaetaceae bacterium]|jgi:chromosome segregation ATPase|nr:hypothetical protein [Spirochaetaceae bacterium]